MSNHEATTRKLGPRGAPRVLQKRNNFVRGIINPSNIRLWPFFDIQKKGLHRWPVKIRWHRTEIPLWAFANDRMQVKYLDSFELASNNLDRFVDFIFKCMRQSWNEALKS